MTTDQRHLPELTGMSEHWDERHGDPRPERVTDNGGRLTGRDRLETKNQRRQGARQPVKSRGVIDERCGFTVPRQIDKHMLEAVNFFDYPAPVPAITQESMEPKHDRRVP